MSNTAERWWVRLAARWLARVDGVSSQLRLAMLGMTGVSTATITLKQYGHGEFAWPLIAVTAIAVLAFTYLYTEGGVWNQVSRDRNDMSSNFAGPTMRIDDELEAVSIVAGIKGRSLTEAEREAIEAELDRAWAKYRDGVTITDLEEQ